MEFWQHIYEHFDPVAFHIFGFPVHWYGIMYVLALLTALFFAEWLVKHDRLSFSKKGLDIYFIWVEVGVILGARLGFILFYDPHTSYYLTHPWQIFNPFLNGHFVGIRGFSYHGAIIGFLLGTYFYAKKYHKNFWQLLDLAAVSVPVGYIFGRIGNFLNQELVGRATDVPWGIYIGDVLRHPSQLYEAFFEGFVLFVILFWYRKYKHFDGELIALYGFFYGLFRFLIEFFREPDMQLGFICCGWMTMGQLLCLAMMGAAIILYIYLRRRGEVTQTSF
ncbi:phosphatidylglycerol---prolipoprotein diacylglyceryl transferase [Nitratiruptor sp. YY08-26]|uniref:prolipoprotein diacylglyceryl transferase n=1 Tax=unclassified Nitratiruptor TaxID=2624044 RepID=UPI001916686D|nr:MULTISPECIES: prolipoprotein diacylglyceryl transferase [unclassified Nitratiruptor]BCD61543.1 phosphatidylglycerol---prolipoprotein diacylglyceryl transferase [Nitratiruptor sp. YY08-13]BCD65477.1 phosphatidylglycerol---prolipoprotein diacylglyceryl transferase [Nitratiruptor sp. YY08-26]